MNHTPTSDLVQLHSLHFGRLAALHEPIVAAFSPHSSHRPTRPLRHLWRPPSGVRHNAILRGRYSISQHAFSLRSIPTVGSFFPMHLRAAARLLVCALPQRGNVRLHVVSCPPRSPYTHTHTHTHELELAPRLTSKGTLVCIHLHLSGTQYGSCSRTVLRGKGKRV